MPVSAQREELSTKRTGLDSRLRSKSSTARHCVKFRIRKHQVLRQVATANWVVAWEKCARSCLANMPSLGSGCYEYCCSRSTTFSLERSFDTSPAGAPSAAVAQHPGGQEENPFRYIRANRSDQDRRPGRRLGRAAPGIVGSP